MRGSDLGLRVVAVGLAMLLCFGVTKALATDCATTRGARFAAGGGLDRAVADNLKGTPWWCHVQEKIAQAEYEITRQGEPYREGVVRATNRAQNLRAFFGPSGVEVTSRTGETDWRWVFELTGFGREGRVATPGPAVLSSQGRRVELERPGVTEWYVNAEEGIEQGFVIHERPEGKGALVLEGSVAGNLEGRFEENSGCVGFFKDGKEVLRYADLLVEDAQGMRLRSRLALGGDRIRIVVEDIGSYPIYVDPLVTSPAWIGEGNQANVQFGCSVAGAGDVNGDGYSDVIVGARTYDNGEQAEGRAFVFYGGASGLSTEPAWTAESNQPAGNFGCSVASAGDVNGDGYSDVIVGAVYYNYTWYREGAAFVYHGGPSGLSADPDWIGGSDQYESYFGRSVACAGDVNGDGYSDVIVGAENYESGQKDEGAAFLYYGSDSGLSPTPGFWLQGNRDIAHFGNCVAGAGDVNGDGYGDIIIGARLWEYGEWHEGRAFVLHGQPVGLLPGWAVESNQVGAEFGYSVASAGDVNGDGYSDVIVGAINEDDNGRAFVYHGSPSGVLLSPSWSGMGIGLGDHYGGSVAGAGDIDGDGYSDVIVAAYHYDNGEVNEGGAWVYFGGAGGLSFTPGWSAEGDQAQVYFGCSAAGAGDVNGDGYADVIVGASHYDNGENNEGRAFVYHGAPEMLAATIDLDPNTLNVKSKGKYVTCYIELPSAFDPGDIDVSTVMLDETVPAEMWPTSVGDYDMDGVPDRMVKFRRAAVIALLTDPDGARLWLDEGRGGVPPVGSGEDHEVTVSGKLTDGMPFSGTDTIRLIDAGDGPPEGEGVIKITPVVSGGAVRIAYEVAVAGPVSLRVYDPAGRLIRTLLDTHKVAGRYEVAWDREADDGRRVSAGVYFIRMEQRNRAQVKKLLVPK